MNKAGVTILIDHLSGGLRARPVFAVATFLEPDIQLDDDILAVRDLTCWIECPDNKLAGLPFQMSHSWLSGIVNMFQIPPYRDRRADVLNLPRRLVRSS
jgi:hypothetical protein